MPSSSQAGQNQTAVYRFSVYELDMHAGELRKFGVRIPIQQQPLQVLAALAERSGELVTREELRALLWPADTFVDFEHSLNSTVKKLRRALDDDPETPRFIETVPRRGYRFLVEVKREEPKSPRTPETFALSASEVPASKPRGLRGWGIVAATAAVVVVAGIATSVVMWRQRLRQPADSNAFKIQSLAVLPLENLSRDPGQEYFAEGLTDALITDLGKVTGLRLISRTSVMPYKSQSKSVPQIARELNVDAIVEGTVLRSENRIRVTVQLVRASPEQHVWSERYEREIGEVIALERELALAIAHEISGRIVEPSQLNGSSAARNERAYDAYFRGRYLWNQRTEAGIREARSYFRQALREDSNFALAWSGLSDSYSISWDGDPDFALAEEYARKALALAPNLAEAHVSLAFAFLRQLKLAQAKAEALRALELNPNSVMARHMLAGGLLCEGRPVEALAENDRALQLDPFSFPVNYMRAAIFMGLREYDRAIEQLHTASAISPELPAPHGSLASIYWLLDRPTEALEEERTQALMSHSPELVRAVEDATTAYQKSGTAAARLTLAHAEEGQIRHSVFHDNVAGVVFNYSALRDRAKTLYWLREAVRVRDGALQVVLMTAAEFDWLRADPEFQQILRDMGVAQ